MNIAFYAPLKSPDHPVPSGDRAMARLLMAALGQGGHRVSLASDLRAFLRVPDDPGAWAGVQHEAAAERTRIAALWRAEGPPDLWFCYHPYYKSPDLIGPPLCRLFGVPYATAEASQSPRRAIGVWAEAQALAADAVAMAAVNFSLTARDAAGLAAAVPGARIERLKPFHDARALPPAPEPGHLVTVAMMRSGDKLQSYRHLAAALRRLPGDWRLTVAGDGPERPAVEALFAGLPVAFAGLLDAAGVARLLSRGALYLWPGCGEAFGLAYLEAQAAGLPVVAFRTAGVPEVVADGETGALVPEGDDMAFASAVATLLADPAARIAMGRAAIARVARDHAPESAARAIGGALAAHVPGWAA